ncbi:MFS transporter [Sporomusa termitida]|uniref:Uncharacterized protein n=1 Tax=Sporomusa termitida TaxID=2377 RepID=A0A517DZZ7_9FIRM|nr:MFS transporter [Sporomusa termitida]QDR82934.1 hypothetical protein SPTER_43830 [Sporomusa termitida]
MTGLVIAAVYQGIFVATLSYLVQLHYSETNLIFGITWGAASVAGFLQALRWGWEPWLAPWFGKISDGRFGRRAILMVTLTLAAALFLLIPVQLPVAVWLLLIVAILLTATILTTVIDAVACYSPQKAFMTAYALAIDIGAALGPFIGYTLNEVWGPYAIYGAIAGSLLLLAAKWIFWPIDIYKTV